MAKTAVSQWDTTAANNTDIGGISIAEGMAPSDVNNAMREGMAQIRGMLNSTTFRLFDTTDATKALAFDLSGLTTATTRTLTVPDADMTFVGTNTSQTLTNKALQTPTITLKQSANPSPTAEGDIQWDTAADRIVVGNSSGQSFFGQVTPWVAYTPTFTSFGTVTNVSFASRRVGDTLEIQGHFTCGTTTASEARVSLGFNGVDGGLTISTAKMATRKIVGVGGVNYVVAASFYTQATGGHSYLTFGVQSASRAATDIVTAQTIGNSGTVFTFTASVPITGW